MVLRLETDAATQIVSTADAKTHLKVSGSSEDSYIDSLVVSARKSIERYLKRALITQTWKAYYDYWEDVMNLGIGPVQSVTSVKYYDYTASLSTLSAASYYYADTISEPGAVVRRYDAVYPETETNRPNAIVIEFVAGYGDAVTDVPSDLVHAVKLLLTDLYDNRGEVVVGTNATRIPGHIQNLIHDYRLYDFAH